MISIIISSADNDVLQKVLRNINETIGVPYQTIVIENAQGKYSICEAYNSGAAKAKFDVYCFMHEDISFDTVGWGQKAIDHLLPGKIGLVGLAGGDTKSLAPSSWASLISASEISYVQHFKDTSKPPERIYRTSTPGVIATSKQVICLDGFWMCTTRTVFEKYFFDEKTFTGFHGYDIDFSLQVAQEYKVEVIFDIVVNHYSEGSFTKEWMKSAMLLSDKWKEKLPMSVHDLPTSEFLRQHWTALNSFIDKLIQLNYRLPLVLYYYCKYSFNQFFYRKHFLYFLRYIFLKYFKGEKGLSN